MGATVNAAATPGSRKTDHKHADNPGIGRTIDSSQPMQNHPVRRDDLRGQTVCVEHRGLEARPHPRRNVEWHTTHSPSGNGKEVFLANPSHSMYGFKSSIIFANLWNVQETSARPSMMAFSEQDALRRSMHLKQRTKGRRCKEKLPHPDGGNQRVTAPNWRRASSHPLFYSRSRMTGQVRPIHFNEGGLP